MKCANCGHDEHIIVILNGSKMTKCIKCQVYQEAKEEPNPNRSERWGGIGSLDFNGSHNSCYRSK